VVEFRPLCGPDIARRVIVDALHFRGATPSTLFDATTLACPHRGRQRSRAIAGSDDQPASLRPQNSAHHAVIESALGYKSAPRAGDTLRLVVRASCKRHDDESEEEGGNDSSADRLTCACRPGLAWPQTCYRPYCPVRTCSTTVTCTVQYSMPFSTRYCTTVQYVLYSKAKIN
jgi:hypothetical protein